MSCGKGIPYTLNIVEDNSIKHTYSINLKDKKTFSAFNHECNELGWPIPTEGIKTFINEEIYSSKCFTTNNYYKEFVEGFNKCYIHKECNNTGKIINYTCTNKKNDTSVDQHTFNTK